MNRSKRKSKMHRSRQHSLACRTPQEWRDMIDALDIGHVERVQVATIIWWDYFGERVTSQRWPHLDDIRSQWRDVAFDRATVVNALATLGYAPHRAELRVDCDEAMRTKERSGR